MMVEFMMVEFMMVEFMIVEHDIIYIHSFRECASSWRAAVYFFDTV